jgi:hypothetical protein
MLQYVIYLCDVRDVASGKVSLYMEEVACFIYLTTLSVAETIASHGRVINKLKGKNMEEAAVGYFEVLSQHSR